MSTSTVLDNGIIVCRDENTGVCDSFQKSTPQVGRSLARSGELTWQIKRIYIYI